MSDDLCNGVTDKLSIEATMIGEDMRRAAVHCEGKDMKPRVFIGSSRESLKVAYAVQESLEHQAEITVWSKGIFELSKSDVESLVTALDRIDFGIFVFGKDDVVRLRSLEYQAARDNVVFELGLFAGRIGKDRNFLVVPTGLENFLPTDLLGMTFATFDSHQDGNMRAAINPACSKILKTVQKSGPIRSGTEASSDGKVRPSLLTPDSPLLNQLINSAIQTVCRAVALPQSPETSRIRVFIFRKQASQLICSHYWAPNPVREMVGRLRFNITSEVSKSVAVVRSVINKEITRTKVSPLPEGPDSMRREISDELSFVLAAPIYGADGSVWGTVDFDASTQAAQAFLSDEVSDAAMFQLAKHLQIIFSLPS